MPPFYWAQERGQMSETLTPWTPVFVWKASNRRFTGRALHLQPSQVSANGQRPAPAHFGGKIMRYIVMIPRITGLGLGLALLLSVMGGPTTAGAVELITNGGFEVGLVGWARTDQVGSFPGSTWFVQSGTFSPASFLPVPPPPGPTHAAMSDGLGPGSHVLFQNFVVPFGVTSAALSFDRFIGNRDAAFFTPSSLDFTVIPNQQARVDILIGTPSSEFSVAAADVLANIFQTQVGDPLVAGYTLQTTGLTALLQAHQGQTLQLRFAEVDNQNFFQFGVDVVSLSVATAAAVPEPASLALLGSGVLALAAICRRSRRGSAAQT